MSGSILCSVLIIRVTPDLTLKSGWSWIWPDLGTQIRPEPDLAETCFQVTPSQNNYASDKTNDINNAVSSSGGSIVSASFVVLLFASLAFFDKICRMAMNFVFFEHTCITRIPLL